MYPHPVLSEWQVQQFYADAAQRAAPHRYHAEVSLLDQLTRLAQALHSRLPQRAAHRAAGSDARACPHTSL